MSEPGRHCPYCGAPIDARRTACAAHADLPDRDPNADTGWTRSTTTRTRPGGHDASERDGRD